MASDYTAAGAWPQAGAQSAAARVGNLVQRRRWLVLLVIAPTLLVAAYMYVVSARQYVSESRFMVRSQGLSGAPSILGQVLGAATGGGAAPSMDEAAGAVSFLQSHDAVDALKKDVDLVGVWRRNGLDVFSGIKANPREEDLQRFYEKRVKAVLSSSTGIVTLTVRTFRPEDSRLISEKLLTYSEALVNRFSLRAEQDAMRIAQEEAKRAGDHLSQITGQLTQYRTQQQVLDPSSSVKVVTEVVGALEGQAARARAELSALRTYLRPGTPRLQEQETRLAALEAQLASQRSRLTGGDRSLTPSVGGFERLGTDREIASKTYASALAALETSRLDALKQHAYLVRIVQPNLPDKSTYPVRWQTTLSVFGALLLAYGIGWLILMGVREHAA